MVAGLSEEASSFSHDIRYFLKSNSSISAKTKERRKSQIKIPNKITGNI